MFHKLVLAWALVSAVVPLEWSDPDRFVTVAEVAEDAAIDLAPDGTLYVLDRRSGGVGTVEDGRVAPVPGTEQLKVIDVDAVDGAVYLLTETELWRATGGAPTLLFGTLTEAGGLAVDATGGVYVAEYLPSGDGLAAARIRRIAPDGTATTVAGEGDRRRGDHNFDGSPATEVRLQRPGGLAFDSQGVLYFTDYIVAGPFLVVLTIGADGRIREFSRTLVDDHKSRDGGLAVGADGRVHVLDYRRGVGGVRVFDPDGGQTSAGPNVFEPRDVAVGPDGGVHLAARGRVMRLRADATDDSTGASPGPDPWADQEPGAVLTVAGPPSDPGRRGLGSAPQDVAVGTDGAVHVVEDGRLHTVLGSDKVSRRLADTKAGDLHVVDVAPAEDGALFVLVDATYREKPTASPQGPESLVLLVHPDKDEVPILVGGPPTQGNFPNSAESLVWPTRVTSAGDRLYVSGMAGPVSVFERDGSFREVATISVLQRFAVDAGAVYFVDDSARLTRVEPGEQPQPVSDMTFHNTNDLAVATDGTVYVAADDGIRALAPDRTVSTVTPDKADRLAVDAHGNVYFADSRKVRVVVRPGQVTEFPWFFVVASVVALATVGAGFLVFRHRRRRTEADATTSARGAE